MPDAPAGKRRSKLGEKAAGTLGQPRKQFWAN